MGEEEGRKLGEGQCLGSREVEEVLFVEVEVLDVAVSGLVSCLS